MLLIVFRHIGSDNLVDPGGTLNEIHPVELQCMSFGHTIVPRRVRSVITIADAAEILCEAACILAVGMVDHESEDIVVDDLTAKLLRALLDRQNFLLDNLTPYSDPAAVLA